MCGRNDQHRRQILPGKCWGNPSESVRLSEEQGEVYIKSLRLKFIPRDPAVLQFPESCTLFHHFASRPSGVNPESACAQTLIKQTLVTKSHLNVSVTYGLSGTRFL